MAVGGRSVSHPEGLSGGCWGVPLTWQCCLVFPKQAVQWGAAGPLRAGLVCRTRDPPVVFAGTSPHCSLGGGLRFQLQEGAAVRAWDAF